MFCFLWPVFIEHFLCVRYTRLLSGRNSAGERDEGKSRGSVFQVKKACVSPGIRPWYVPGPVRRPEWQMSLGGKSAQGGQRKDSDVV